MRKVKTVQKVPSPKSKPVKTVKQSPNRLDEEWGYYEGDDPSLREFHSLYEAEPSHRYFN